MICIYDIGNEDFDGNGNAVLTPTEGTVKQEAGGNYDLTLTHPMDAEGKWLHIVPGAVVKAPVPREVIENAYAGYDADVYKTTAKTDLRESASEPSTISYPAWVEAGAYEVGSKVTFGNKNWECTYYDRSSIEAHVIPSNSAWWKEIARTTPGAPVLVTLPVGTDLYLIEDYDTNWYKMATYYGIEGYVKKSAITFDRHLTPAEVQPRIITEQLFRLQRPTIDNEKRTVTVTGQHVSYDLAGILTESLSIAQATPGMALGRIMDSLMIPYRGTIATNLGSDDAGTYTGDTSGKNGMFMLMDPDKGIINAFGAKFTRDNWDLFVMKKSGEVSSYRIIYGKNMRGVTWKQDSSGIITRVVPVAKDAGGNDLYLPEKWVDSENIDDYPAIRMERLKVSGQVGKDKGEGDGSTWTESDLLDYMREQAEERYSIDHADEIVHEVTVQFEQIGDTAEYPWLKELESVLLYDNIRCSDQNIGLEKVLTVTTIEWDIVRRKIRGIRLSNITGGTVRSVTGYHVQNNSISPAKLTDDVAGGIIEQVKDIIPEYADPEAARPGIVTVTDSDPTLAWGTRSKVGTVQGTDLHVTMPSNPASKFEGIAIQANDDLNDYKTPGNYYSTGEQISSTLSNIPSGLANQMFVLQVLSDGANVFQLAYGVTQYVSWIYIRKTQNSGTEWSVWKQASPNIANNLTTTDTGLVLDASQGKVLNDKVVPLETAIGQREIKTYKDVTTLGLTDGSATILAAFRAMPTGSMLVAPASQFATAELPKVGTTAQTTVTITIVKSDTGARSYVEARTKDSTAEWQMGLGATAYNGNHANEPTGDWMRINRLNMNPGFTGDIDTLLKPGTYYLNGATSGTFSGTMYGTLLVEGNSWDNADGGRVSQLYIGAGAVGCWQRRYTGSWQKRNNMLQRFTNLPEGGTTTVSLPSACSFTVMTFRTGTTQTGAFGFYVGFAGTGSSVLVPVLAPTTGVTVSISGLTITLTTTATNIGMVVNYEYFE